MSITDKMILVTEIQRKCFKVRHSDNTGGKAGKGNNKTRSFMVIREHPLKSSGYISYTPGDLDSELKALRRASRWIEKDTLRSIQENGVCEICSDPDCKSDHK